MTTADTRKTYWLTQEKWYRINKEKDCFEILPNAPERVKRSFEMWNSNDGHRHRR